MRIEFAAGLLGPRLFQRTFTFCAAVGETIFCAANGILAPFGGFASPPQIDYFAHLSTRASACVLVPKFALIRNERDTSNSMILMPISSPTFASDTCRMIRANLGSAALALGGQRTPTVRVPVPPRARGPFAFISGSRVPARDSPTAAEHSADTGITRGKASVVAPRLEKGQAGSRLSPAASSAPAAPADRTRRRKQSRAAPPLPSASFRWRGRLWRSWRPCRSRSLG